MAITILDYAIHLGAKESEDGSINGEELARLNLPMFGGCEGCAASIACYNAYPSNSGYIRCAGCIGERGFETAEELKTYLEA